MNYLKLNLKKESISKLNLSYIIDSLKNIEGESFYCDLQGSEELTAEMKKDAICCKWDYLIFYSSLKELCYAKVFVRVDDSGFELFNINSTDIKFSMLSVDQYNKIVLAFKRFVGVSMSKIVDVEQFQK